MSGNNYHLEAGRYSNTYPNKTNISSTWTCRVKEGPSRTQSYFCKIKLQFGLSSGHRLAKIAMHAMLSTEAYTHFSRDSGNTHIPLPTPPLSQAIFLIRPLRVITRIPKAVMRGQVPNFDPFPIIANLVWQMPWKFHKHELLSRISIL